MQTQTLATRLAALLLLLSTQACQREPASTGGSNPSGAPSSAAGRPAGGPAGGGPPGFAGGAAAVTGVYLESINVETLSDSISALGTTAANESVTVSAKVTESVSRINFSDGDRVQAGDVLVELSGKAELANLKETQAAYLEASQQFDRFSGLKAKGTVTQAQVDTAKANIDQTRARLDAVRARLSDRVITAPFSGVLGFRQVSPGTLLTPGTAIVTLDDIETLTLDFSIPETALASVREGDIVSARSAAYINENFEGQVASIDSRIDPATRAFTVRARLTNRPDATGRLQLKPGMLLNVVLKVRPRHALMVNEIAVLQNGDESFVYKFIADNQPPEIVKLTLGTRVGGKVEVVTGLQAGDRVVTEGNVKLRPNMAVREVMPAAVTADAPVKG